MSRTLRGIGRAPWYSAAVVGVIALSLTLAMTVFAVVDGVLFKSLPYERPHELFLVHHLEANDPADTSATASVWELRAWERAAPDLAFAHYEEAVSAPTLLGGQYAYRFGISSELLDVLGVRPLTGGLTQADSDWFLTAQASPDQRFPVLITHELWQRKFEGDPDVVGRAETLVRSGSRLSGFRVAGVLPESFAFPTREGDVAPELLIPLTSATTTTSSSLPSPQDAPPLHVLVRVPVGQHPSDVERRLTTATQPGRPTGAVRLVPLSDYLGSRERGEFSRLAIAVLGLFLLALMNVIGLAIARASSTQRDVAIRRALGAGWWRLARHTLAEVGPLVLAAVAMALLASPWLLTRTVDLLPAGMTLLKRPAIDARVWLVGAGVAVVTMAVVTWWVTRASARVGAPGLLSGTTRSTPGQSRTGRGFLGAQVALGSVLLVVASLFSTSLASAWRSDTGYTNQDMLLVEAGPVAIDDAESLFAQTAELRSLLASVPGVAAVASSDDGFVSGLNYDGRNSSYVPLAMSDRVDGVKLAQVSHEYFDVLGMRLSAGRWPSAAEWASRSVAVVSQMAAARFWPDQAAVGQVLHSVDTSRGPRGAAAPSRLPVTVVGVVTDARYMALDRSPLGYVYVPPQSMDWWPASNFFVASHDQAADVRARLEAALAQDHRFHVDRIRTVEEALAASVRWRTLRAWLFGWFGFAALVVLGAGMLGVVATSTAARTREVGVRMALGASPARILRLFVMEQAAPVGVGLLAGVIAAAWAVPYLRAQLYGVGPYDVGVWALALGATVTTTVVAALLPSLRASRADPARTLRLD